MSRYSLATPFVEQWFNENGAPESGATLTAYLAGTTTETEMYTDSSGTSAGSVITLNSRGEPEVSGNVVPIWLDNSLDYKFKLTSTTGGWTIDNIPGATGGGGSDFLQVNTVNGAGDKLYDYVGEDVQQAHVGGFTTIGDGGSHIWYWDAFSTVADLSAGGYAVLPTGHVGAGRWLPMPMIDIDPVVLGADDTGTNPSADAWLSCIAWGEATGNQSILFTGTHVIEKTVDVPIGWWIRGVSPWKSILKTAAGTTYYNTSGVLSTAANSGFVFFMNIDSTGDTTTWINQFPNTSSGGVENVQCSGVDTSGSNWFYFAGSHAFRDIRCDNVATLIEKPNLYTDALEIKRVHAQTNRQNDTDYLIYLPGLGDGYDINYVAAGGIPEQLADAVLGLYVGSCRGGCIANLINGWHYFDNTGPAVSITNGHFESGGLELDSCDVTVSENMFDTEKDVVENINGRYGIKLTNTQGNTTQGRRVSVIRRNDFQRMGNFRGGWPTTEYADIRFEDLQSSAILAENTRTISVSGNVSRTQTMAILISLEGSLDNDFNKYAHLMTKNAVQIGQSIVPVNANVPIVYSYSEWGGSGTLDLSANNWTFSGATDTYYYTYQTIVDPVRLLGTAPITTPEFSLSLTNGGDIGFGIVNRASNQNADVIYRIYRGTSTGSYDNYVDVPAMNCWYMYDDGIGVNGFPWQSRSAGAVDTLNPTAQALGGQLVDGVYSGRHTTTNLPPTVGTWKQGDELRRVDITAPGVGSKFISRIMRITSGSTHYYNGSGGATPDDWIRINHEQV